MCSSRENKQHEYSVRADAATIRRIQEAGHRIDRRHVFNLYRAYQTLFPGIGAMIDFKTGRISRDSQQHEVKWDLCRECRTIQHCVTLRGWHVCKTCIEKIDLKFCSERIDKHFEDFNAEKRAANGHYLECPNSIPRTGEPEAFCTCIRKGEPT